MTSRIAIHSLALAFTVVLIVPTAAFRQQSVGVRGRLMCGEKPLSDAKVKLWNKNRIGTDDQLADVKTDANGNYQLDGGVGSIFAMNVKLKVYHDCNRSLPCQRKIVFGIPSDYVSRTSHVSKWFEAGVMNMQLKFPDEESSCIN